MKLLIMGCGSIGERHLKNLIEVESDLSIDLYDAQNDRLSEVSKKYRTNSGSANSIDSQYDCVLICTPPSSHVELAFRAAKAGSNVFIEKPLSSSLDEVDKLVQIMNENRLLGFVAYNFRFNRGLEIVRNMAQDQKFGKLIHASSYFGQYLPDWRPWQDYRKSYTANQSMGGGIILDGSHEVDYISWIIGRPSFVQCHMAYTDILSADTEAIADILLKIDSVPAYIHLDFIRREYRRTLELLCENGIIYWSLSEDVIRTFDASAKQWNEIKLHENINDMYLAEIKHVLNCIKADKKSDLIDLHNGLATLRLSDTIHRAGKTGERISV